MKKIILLILITLTINSVNAKFKILGLEKVKNSLKENIKTATKLTKENFNKFVKRSDDFEIKTTKDIFRFIITPKQELENEILQELNKFGWGQDLQFIKQFNKTKDKNEKIKLLNEKIIKLHPTTKAPILQLTDDLIYESYVCEDSLEKIKDFIEKQKSKSSFLELLNKDGKKLSHFFSNLNMIVDRINKMKENLDIISDFLNNMFKS